MAWPPTPLPINFTNATVSLDTHPQAHNATNLQLNNDIVPENNTIRTGLPAAPGTFTPTLSVAGTAVTLGSVLTRWTRNYSVVTAYARFNIFAIIGNPTGEATFGFTGLPFMEGGLNQPIGSLNWTDTDNSGFLPTGQAVFTAPSLFAAVMNNGAYLNTTFSAGDSFRWTITYMI